MGGGCHPSLQRRRGYVYSDDDQHLLVLAVSTALGVYLGPDSGNWAERRLLGHCDFLFHISSSGNGLVSSWTLEDSSDLGAAEPRPGEGTSPLLENSK